MRRVRWVGSLLLTALAACGGASQTEVEKLAQEIGALRGELQVAQRVGERDAERRAALRDALAPFQQALEHGQRQHRLDLERSTALVGELQRVTGMLQPRAGSEREELSRLQQRLQEVEQGLKGQKETLAAEQALILRALDAAVERLDALLRHLEPGAPASAPTTQPAKSGVETPPGWLWLVLGLLAAAAAGAFLGRASPARVPPEPARGTGDVTNGGPRHVRLVLAASKPEALVEVVRATLAQEPAVLVEPAPRVTVEEGRLSVDWWLEGNSPMAVATRIEAVVQCAVAGAQRRRASAVA
jgi:hypothetical protein